MGYADAEAVWRLWHKGKPLPPCVSGVWQCVSCAVLAAVMSWAEHALLLSGLISSPVGAAAGSFCWGAALLLASLGKKNGAEQRFAVRCVLIASPKANGWEQSSWAQCPVACPLCLRFEHQHHHGWQSILMRCFLGGWALNVICSLISQVATGFMMSSLFPVPSAAHCLCYSFWVTFLTSTWWAKETPKITCNSTSLAKDFYSVNTNKKKKMTALRKSFRRAIISSVKIKGSQKWSTWTDYFKILVL